MVPAESESGAAAPQQGSAPAAAPPAAAPGGAGGLAWKPSVTEAQKAEFSLEFAHFVNQTLLSLRKAEISASEARNAVAAAQAKSAGKLPASVTAAQLGKKLLNKSACPRRPMRRPQPFLKRYMCGSALPRDRHAVQHDERRGAQAVIHGRVKRGLSLSGPAPPMHFLSNIVT